MQRQSSVELSIAHSCKLYCWEPEGNKSSPIICDQLTVGGRYDFEKVAGLDQLFAWGVAFHISLGNWLSQLQLNRHVERMRGVCRDCRFCGDWRFAAEGVGTSD